MKLLDDAEIDSLLHGTFADRASVGVAYIELKNHLLNSMDGATMSTDDIKRIHNRMDSLEQVLRNMSDVLIRHTTLEDSAIEKLSEVRSTLYGNGKPGIVTRVDRLETTRKVWMQAATATIGFLSGLIATFLGIYLQK